VENIAKEAFQCGASKVYAVDGALFKAFNAEAYSKAASFLLDSINRKLALFRATSQGTDVRGQARHVSVRPLHRQHRHQGGGRTNKAHTGCLRGNYTVTVVNEKAKPQVATVRPKAFPMPEKDASKSGELIRKLTLGEADLNAKFLEFIKSQTEGKPRQADIIVSGGRAPAARRDLVS